MSSIPSIELPAELVPGDGRFGSGPSKVRTESLLELGVTGASFLGTSHRQPTVKAVVGAIRHGMEDLFSLPDNYEVVLGVGGATAFWASAAYGLIEKKSQHLDFGVFSGKFAKVVAGAPHLEEPEVIKAEIGSHPLPVPNPEVDLYALTHNETTTGVMMPIVRPEASGVVAVDATSAAGGMAVDPDQYDVYYFSPQKVFGAEGGLWIAFVSPAGVDRIEKLGASDRWTPGFLSLKLALDNSRKDQTTNTPALATLFLVKRQVEYMLEMGGLDWAVGRCDRSSEIVYSWAESAEYAYPFVSDPEKRSTNVATVNFVDEIDAGTVAAILRANGILDTGGYRALGQNQLRIAMFPNVEPSDLERLTKAIDYIVERM
ncbi:MAG: phosphoserine transaminase [Acidimicrobiia bacterium]|nr:phosphoserine transaminase [Acidimicrobiia bacterium]